MTKNKQRYDFGIASMTVKERKHRKHQSIRIDEYKNNNGIININNAEFSTIRRPKGTTPFTGEGQKSPLPSREKAERHQWPKGKSRQKAKSHKEKRPQGKNCRKARSKSV